MLVLLRLAVVSAGQLMAGSPGLQPYYHPGRVPRKAAWEPIASCPDSLQELLAVNNMVLDDTTSRDGNCGISAFTISIMSAMSSRAATKKDATAEAKRFGCLRRCPHGQRVAQARAAGVDWLHANASAKLWEGMTVTQLVSHVSGEYMATYRATSKATCRSLLAIVRHRYRCAVDSFCSPPTWQRIVRAAVRAMLKKETCPTHLRDRWAAKSLSLSFLATCALKDELMLGCVVSPNHT